MQLSTSTRSRLLKSYGPWALVTGASSGIGYEIARQLALSGFHLIINARDKDRLQKAASTLSLNKVEVIAVQADLATSEGIERILHACRDREIGLLVNNAGFGTSGAFQDASLHAETQLLRVNCESVLALSHHFVQRFVQQRRGGIIFLSSLVAFQGVPFAANYAASKAYVQSFAEALTREVKPFGIDILSAAPGPVHSGFARRAGMVMDRALRPEQVSVPILSAMGKQDLVVPGSLSKLLFYNLRTLPRFFKVRIMQQVMSGFTSHQRVGS